MNAFTDHYIQVTLAIIFGIGMLLIAATVSEKRLIKGLILLIPFQLIQSQFGTLNVVLVYMIFLMYLLRGNIRHYPLGGSVALIILVYVLSYTLTPKATRVDHILYMVSIFSNFFLFYLVYNFVSRLDDWRYAWNTVITLNVLVVLYCFLQLIVGFGKFSLFGLAELSLTQNNEGGQRLAGPFKAIAMTAEYFDIQIMIIGYAIINEVGRRRKLFLLTLLAFNCAILVGTGNRGGLVSLIVGGAAFLYLFRGQIGTVRAIKIAVVFPLVFALASVVMITFTDFNVLYERVEETEFEGAMPVFREGWEGMWPRVFEKPVLGHGPRLKMRNEDRRIDGFRPFPYPHNAYMYIFYTLGAVGFFAYGIFLLSICIRYVLAANNRSEDKYLSGMPRLGLVIVVVSTVSQIRMEMFRYALVDFQHYVFMLLAVMLAFSDILRGKIKPVPKAVKDNKTVSVPSAEPVNRTIAIPKRDNHQNS